VTSSCCAVDEQFDERVAKNDLKRFRRRGPDAATRQILAALEKAHPPSGATLLDIGGGVGAIHHSLLEHGFDRAVQVDASAAYLGLARLEADRLGHGDRVEFRHGDFRSVASEVPTADAVTLDRVVCCDPDYQGLLTIAAAHARAHLALSYPRDRWYVRAVVTAMNGWRALWGRAFRVYLHSPSAMTQVLARAGLRRRWAGGTFIWSVELFERAPSHP
jgi:magnesium-protoporphyrin O-methyltransferase